MHWSNVLFCQWLDVRLWKLHFKLGCAGVPSLLQLSINLLMCSYGRCSPNCWSGHHRGCLYDICAWKVHLRLQCSSGWRVLGTRLRHCVCCSSVSRSQVAGEDTRTEKFCNVHLVTRQHNTFNTIHGISSTELVCLLFHCLWYLCCQSPCFRCGTINPINVICNTWFYVAYCLLTSCSVIHWLKTHSPLRAVSI